MLGIVAGRCWYENAHKGHQEKITSFSYESNLDFTLLLKARGLLKNSFQKCGSLTDVLYFDLLN